MAHNAGLKLGTYGRQTETFLKNSTVLEERKWKGEIWKDDFFFSERKENMHDLIKTTLWWEGGVGRIFCVCIKKHSNKTVDTKIKLKCKDIKTMKLKSGNFWEADEDKMKKEIM